MPAANEREDTFNEETRLRWLGGGDQRVRSSLLVCVTKRIKHLAILVTLLDRISKLNYSKLPCHSISFISAAVASHVRCKWASRWAQRAGSSYQYLPGAPNLPKPVSSVQYRRLCGNWNMREEKIRPLFYFEKKSFLPPIISRRRADERKHFHRLLGAQSSGHH